MTHGQSRAPDRAPFARSGAHFVRLSFSVWVLNRYLNLPPLQLPFWGSPAVPGPEQKERQDQESLYHCYRCFPPSHFIILWKQPFNGRLKLGVFLRVQLSSGQVCCLLLCERDRLI